MSEDNGAPRVQLIIGRTIADARLLIGDLDVFKVLRVRRIEVSGIVEERERTRTILTLEVMGLPQHYDISPDDAAAESKGSGAA